MIWYNTDSQYVNAPDLETYLSIPEGSNEVRLATNFFTQNTDSTQLVLIENTDGNYAIVERLFFRESIEKYFGYPDIHMTLVIAVLCYMTAFVTTPKVVQCTKLMRKDLKNLIQTVVLNPENPLLYYSSLFDLITLNARDLPDVTPSTFTVNIGQSRFLESKTLSNIQSHAQNGGLLDSFDLDHKGFTPTFKHIPKLPQLNERIKSEMLHFSGLLGDKPSGQIPQYKDIFAQFDTLFPKIKENLNFDFGEYHYQFVENVGNTGLVRPKHILSHLLKKRTEASKTPWTQWTYHYIKLLSQIKAVYASFSFATFQ